MRDPYYGYTALHIAAAAGNIALVGLLIEQPNLEWGRKDRWGRDPLDIAIEAGHPKIASTLLTYRAEKLGLTGRSNGGKLTKPGPPEPSIR